MGQQLSSLTFFPKNELGLSLRRKYDTTYHSLTSVKLQPDGGNLFAAANESGTLLIYDILSEDNNPQQFKILGFESGGITELLWINRDILAAGTTRGKLIILSFKNEKRRAVEVCCVKAHGDGAAQVPVQGMDYCPETRRLASIGQGVNSIRLWTVSDDGNLIAIPVENSPTTYCEPRFVSFTAQGSQLLIGFLENASVQRYTVDSMSLVDEHILGQSKGAADNRQLGNGILLKNSNRFAIHNLWDGLDIFDASAKFIPLSSVHFNVNHCSSQGISALQDGRYLVSPSTKGRIFIYRTRDGTLAGCLRVPGRRSQVKAIHSNNDLSGQNIIVSASYTDSQVTTLCVWTDHNQRTSVQKYKQSRGEYSPYQVGILSIVIVFVCVLCQVVVSVLMPVWTANFLPATSQPPFLPSNDPIYQEMASYIRALQSQAQAPSVLSTEDARTNSEAPVDSDTMKKGADNRGNTYVTSHRNEVATESNRENTYVTSHRNEVATESNRALASYYRSSPF